MNLKNKIADLEKRLKVRERQGIAVITAYSESEFEGKRLEYLKSNPEPGLFVYIRKFTYQQILNNSDNSEVNR
ncbi:hypothetical protein ACFLZG_05590 [Thermodesulfobacteriota bacterium]